MSEPENRESRAHQWMVAIVGGTLAAVLSTYLLYALPPEKLRVLFSGRQAVVNNQGQNRREGWAYLGTFKDGVWSESNAAVGSQPPVTGERVKITTPLNLRIAKPVWPFLPSWRCVGRTHQG